jgi:uncharacterized RDD family membrane protein YckC
MKCKKCGNDYPSKYYFATDDICNDCFSKMDDNEKQQLDSSSQYAYDYPPVYYRVGFGTRLGAAIIDWIIVNIITIFIMYLTGFFDVIMGMVNEIAEHSNNIEFITEQIEQFSLENISFFVLIYLINLVYYFLEVMIGASVGKMILHIQIAKADRTAGTFKELLNRYLIKHSDTIFNLLATLTFISILDLLSFLAFVVIFIGCFFVLGDQRQALHDMIAKTAVYYKDQILEEDKALNQQQIY